MKNLYKVILNIVLLLLSISMYGQISLGGFTGVNFGKLTGDGPDNGYYSNNPGLNTGVLLDVSVNDIVKLSLQPSFSQEGTKVLYSQYGNLDPIDSIQLRLNYLSVPVLVKIQSTNKHFYAIGGIEAGFLMNYQIYSNGKKLDNYISIEKINVAVHFGAGYRIVLGYPVLFIELRYSQGLLNITDEPIKKSYIPRVKTTGFKAIVGIELPLSKSNK